MTKNPPRLINELAAVNFKGLLGEGWYRLHPAIQRRFSIDSHHQNHTVIYRGIMREVKMSFVGKLFANFSRLLGTPLSIHAGIDVPCEVRVYPNPKLGGMVWDRLYYFPQKPVNRVMSTKCILPVKGLIEVATSGFGMFSHVYAQDGAIVFESKRFFFTLGKYKIPIPHILSPGKTIASQRALNDDQFEFTLHIEHRLFGAVFHQVGVFREVGE